MTTTTATTEVVRTPAQLAAIRKSYGLRQREKAIKAAKAKRIRAYYGNKARTEAIEAWKKDKIAQGYKDRAAKKHAANAQPLAA